MSEQEPRTCTQCGYPIDDDVTGPYCWDCAMVIGLGGAAHYMVEKILEQERRKKKLSEE
jgi:hypothetical protein